MDKGLTVPKWVLIVRPKIPQMTQTLSAQSVCSSPKVLDFNEKRHHWASVVRGCKQIEFWRLFNQFIIIIFSGNGMTSFTVLPIIYMP